MTLGAVTPVVKVPQGVGGSTGPRLFGGSTVLGKTWAAGEVMDGAAGKEMDGAPGASTAAAGPAGPAPIPAGALAPAPAPAPVLAPVVLDPVRLKLPARVRAGALGPAEDSGAPLPTCPCPCPLCREGCRESTRESTSRAQGRLDTGGLTTRTNRCCSWSVVVRARRHLVHTPRSAMVYQGEWQPGVAHVAAGRRKEVRRVMAGDSVGIGRGASDRCRASRAGAGTLSATA